jgi:hypothetical protein
LVGDGDKVKGEAIPVCKGNGWEAQGIGSDGELRSFAEWMRSVLDETPQTGTADPRALKEMLGRLAERVSHELVKEG